MINIVNKYKHTPTECDLYIGRGSPLGNLFSHVPSGLASYRVSTREEAVAKYSDWLQQNREKPVVKKALEDAVALHQKHGSLNLVCFCAPKLCHGEVIKKVLEEMLSK